MHMRRTREERAEFKLRKDQSKRKQTFRGKIKTVAALNVLLHCVKILALYQKM